MGSGFRRRSRRLYWDPLDSSRIQRFSEESSPGIPRFINMNSIVNEHSWVITPLKYEQAFILNTKKNTFFSPLLRGIGLYVNIFSLIIFCCCNLILNGRVGGEKKEWNLINAFIIVASQIKFSIIIIKEATNAKKMMKIYFHLVIVASKISKNFFFVRQI